jgi:hypothetical protein
MMPRGVRLNPEHDDRTRAKIQTSQIVNRLTKLVFGEVEMPPHAVSAALGLLRKTLPDLSQSDVTHTHKRDATEYSREDLAAILAESHARNGGEGIAAEDGRDGTPDSVH